MRAGTGPLKTKRAVLILNPAAGRARSKGVALAIRRLIGAGFDVDVRRPESVEETIRVGREVSRADRGRRSRDGSPPDFVLVAGGDGTLAAVLQEYNLDSRVPLALLPLGTANVVARDAGISLRVDVAVEQALRGEEISINVGRCDWEDGRTKRFVLSVSAGLPADVVRSCSPELKRSVGRMAYAAAFWDEWQKGRPKVRVRAGGSVTESDSVIALASRRYAGPFLPDGNPSVGDGLLDVYYIPGERMQTVRALAELIRPGGWSRSSLIRSEKRSEIVIESDCGLEMDGDPSGFGPVRLSIEGTITLRGDAH